MQDLKALQERIERELAALNLPKNPDSLYEPLRYFLKIGGKRIRPILVLLAADLFDNHDERLMNQAIAIELFHNFSLIHDDIMDHAPLRRGLPTIHEKWNLAQGILSGDVLLIWAYQYLLKARPEHLEAVLKSFNNMAVEVCEGQQLDMDFELMESVQIEQYIEMIRLKTSVLLGCALEIGAISSNASEADCKALYDFGVNIGIAFQIQDDLLDAFGNAEKFGKQVGGDIIANKKTFLYLKALSLANEEQLDLLQKQSANSNHEEKIAAVLELFEELSIKEVAKLEMNRYYHSAMKNLEAISAPNHKKEILRKLAEYLIVREE